MNTKINEQAKKTMQI